MSLAIWGVTFDDGTYPTFSADKFYSTREKAEAAIDNELLRWQSYNYSREQFEIVEITLDQPLEGS